MYNDNGGRMNIILFGGAGFIGTNLIIRLAQNQENQIVVVDKCKDFFSDIMQLNLDNVSVVTDLFDEGTDFDKLVSGQDIVYHLVSTTVPTTANQHIAQELTANVIITVNLLEACARNNIKKVVFLSSGGTVYGREAECPIREEAITYPINSYGLQKITIEKLIYLYWCMYDLDYRIIRLANPYGPYQRPDGILGAVSTFTYKALKNEEIIVYGDGSIIRDFIYIEDAVTAILNIVSKPTDTKLFNIGCGYGTSIKEVLDTVSDVLQKKLHIVYKPGRKVDVQKNYLDITRYEQMFGKLNPIPLKEGIAKTAYFMKERDE